MELISPSYDILTPISYEGQAELSLIETAARTCYKSEGNNDGDYDKTKRFIKGLIKRHHDAMLEHSFLSVRFVCSRGVSHELVRHRHFSFAQESTRYCDYEGGIKFVKPYWYDSASFNDKKIFEDSLINVEKEYNYYRDCGRSPQECREILPNCTKTEIVVSGNYREWRHALSLRAANTTGPAHPDMNALMCPLLQELYNTLPIIFDDLYGIMFLDKQASKFITSFKC